MKKKEADWIQSPGGGWRLRLPCGESISAECAAEMGYGTPPESAYVKVVEKCRELETENHKLRKALDSVRRTATDAMK